MGTDTGNGGFEIDGKVYDFDPGDPNATGGPVGKPDHGDVHVDHSKKDLSKGTRATLGQYLSDLTKGKEGSSKGVPNAFTVDPPKTPGTPDGTSLSDTKGLPAPIVPTSNSSHFANPADAAHPQGANGTVYDSPDLRQSSGPVPNPATTLGDLGKGKEGKSITGNTLLHDVAKDNTPQPIERYRSTVLSVNRFTANQQLAAVDLNSNTSRQDYNPTFTIRGKTYSANRLAEVGAMLSLRGSQEFPAAFQDGVNPNGAGSAAGALLPSPNQLGVLKINNLLLEARDALDHISNSEVSPSAQVSISPLGNQSWGALNNVDDPFQGLLNLGMIALALAFQAALLLVFEGLASLIGLMSHGGSGPAAARKSDGTYLKGHYYPPPATGTGGFPPNVMSILGLHPTHFPFSDALKTGAVAFFIGGDAAKQQTGLAGQLLGAVKSAASNALSDNSSAGYLIVVSRDIIRSGQVIAAAVSKIGSAFASNPISGIQSIIGLLDVIKHSKLMAAINVFSNLGDAILSEDDFSKDIDADPREKDVISTIDSYDDNAVGVAVKKSRLKRSHNRTKLAWASNRSPVSYLLPESIATITQLDNKLGSFKGPLGLTDPDGKSAVFVQTKADRQQNGARIPRDSGTPNGIDVKKMEAALDAEYVPFYFHDLRTNEVIGFHAFLASLTDDFNANWESSDSYGRVDPVKIYRSTARRINLSFYVAATSEPDFNEMWVKINKLVTLVYPQYTKGRTLTDGTNNTITQPFSQMIGASPLIRLRLGDLFTSNYSRFALARLFGAADGDMKLDGADIKFEGGADIVENAKKALKNAINDSGNTWQTDGTGWAAAVSDGGGGLSLPIPSGPSTPDQAPVFNVAAGDLPYFTFTAKVGTNKDVAIVKPQIMPASEMTSAFGLDPKVAAAHFKALTTKYNSSKSPTTKVVGGSSGYNIPVVNLKLTAKSFRKLLSNAGGQQAIQDIDKLSNFLDIEKNALVKSFREVQGKGLAGVIETMNFDWYERVTWETKPGSRAPKMCKVTLTFSPIHDVSPGIDHMGYNRAPVYGVGGAMGEGIDPDKAS